MIQSINGNAQLFKTFKYSTNNKLTVVINGNIDLAVIYNERQIERHGDDTYSSLN